MIAAKTGDFDLLKFLARFPIEQDSKNIYNWNLFMYACSGGNVDIVEYLLQTLGGPKAEDVGSIGENFFMIACETGNLKLVKKLLEYLG